VKRLLALVVLIAATTVAALADPTNDLKNAMINLSKASAYHMTASIGGHAIEGDVVKPNKMHITAGPMEMIIIDKTSYFKMQGTWHQFSAPGMDRMTAPMTYAQDFAEKAKSNPNINVSDLGMKTVDGAAYHAYLIKDSDGSGSATTVYVDGNGYPARMDVVDSHGTQTVTFSNFNGAITIDAPI
jgi:outer membrane lipoprotein-sorting protein